MILLHDSETQPDFKPPPSKAYGKAVDLFGKLIRERY
jgi:hypothetical protein